MGVEPGSTILLNVGLKSANFEPNCAMAGREGDWELGTPGWSVVRGHKKTGLHEAGFDIVLTEEQAA